MNEYKDDIKKILLAGISIIPIAEGEKRPHPLLGSKHNLLEKKADAEEVERWLDRGVRSWGVAGGAVSGNLMTIDFDEKNYTGLYEMWYFRLEENQRKIVDTCYKNKTRNNGTHLRYRTESPQATSKVAQKLEWNDKTKKEEVVTIAETRGEGSYALIPPSAGYESLQGSLLNLPVITDVMHRSLLEVLETFNEIIEAEKTTNVSSVVQGNRPGDRFNAEATWEGILVPHGWVEVAKNQWIRPGKERAEGISATTDYESRPIFYVFSTNASPFEANKGYSKFRAYTLLEHSGDFKTSARELAERYKIKSSEEDIVEAITLLELEEMLNKIPKETPKVNLIEVLKPTLKELTTLDKWTSEAFVMQNIKDYFKMTKEDAKKYYTFVKDLRVKSAREEREKKVQEEMVALITDRDIDFQEVFNAVSKIGIASVETLKIIIAVVVSAQLRLNPPLWMFLIGVPSSFKTELVGLFSAMKEVYTLDTLTENAFASGYVPPDGSETQDLLPLLDNKSFIIKDLNTLFSMNEEMVKKVLGDLTSIFDGKFQKFTATRGMIEYNALFSMIGCITPSILTKHYNYATQLGPRFFFVKLPELKDEELEEWLEKSWEESDRKGKIETARQIVSSYTTQLIEKVKKNKSEVPTSEIKSLINSTAEFTSKARGVVVTSSATFEDRDGKKVDYYDIKDFQVEQPWRILNQLKSLLQILACINGKTSIGHDELDLIRPIIMSTMPVDRAEVLSVLSKDCSLSTKDLSLKIFKSSKTIRRTTKALETLGILNSYQDSRAYNSGKSPWLYFINEKYASILQAPRPSSESLSQSTIKDPSNPNHCESEDEEFQQLYSELNEVNNQQSLNFNKKDSNTENSNDVPINPDDVPF